MRRHNARILAVLTLYNIDVNQLGFEDSLRCFENIQQVEMEYEYQVDIDYDFSRILVVSTMQNIEEIDKMIEKSLVKYTMDRLSYVDRAIIRMCTYEMMYSGIAREVAIDEALLITREYSNLEDDTQVKFNNRLLDNIAKNIYE